MSNKIFLKMVKFKFLHLQKTIIFQQKILLLIEVPLQMQQYCQSVN